MGIGLVNNSLKITKKQVIERQIKISLPGTYAEQYGDCGAVQIPSARYLLKAVLISPSVQSRARIKSLDSPPLTHLKNTGVSSAFWPSLQLLYLKQFLICSGLQLSDLLQFWLNTSLATLVSRVCPRIPCAPKL